MLVTLLAHIAFCALLLRGAMRSLSPPLAIVVVYAITGVLASVGYSLVVSDYLVFFVLFLSVWMLERKDPAPAAFVVVGAVAAAAQLLVKLNGGVLCIIMLAFAVWRCRPGGARSLALLASPMSPRSRRSGCSPETASRICPPGFGSRGTWRRRMQGRWHSKLPGRSGEYVEAGLVALLLVVRWPCGFSHSDGLARFAWPRSSSSFPSATGRKASSVTTCTRSRSSQRPPSRCWPSGGEAYAGIAASAASSLRLSRPHTAPRLWRRFSVSSAAVARGGVPLSRQSLLPRPTRTGDRRGSRRHQSRLGSTRACCWSSASGTVDVEPYETSAFGRMDSSGVQSSCSRNTLPETAALDSANAEALDERERRGSCARNCGRSRRQAPAVRSSLDHMVLVCRYRQLSSTGSWAVFRRGVDRCGKARLLGSASTAAGKRCPYPARRRRNIVFARIQVNETTLQRLERLLLKRKLEPSITVDGEQYRLVPATATGPLILRMPAAAGMSASAGGAVDYSRLGCNRCSVLPGRLLCGRTHEGLAWAGDAYWHAQRPPSGHRRKRERAHRPWSVAGKRRADREERRCGDDFRLGNRCPGQGARRERCWCSRMAA